jgi:DNA polymerase III epsilon subunit-like protein
LQLALWWFNEHKEETPPANFRLGTLCEYFGIPLRAEDAHDALADVRATVLLYKAMMRNMERVAAA